MIFAIKLIVAAQGLSLICDKNVKLAKEIKAKKLGIKVGGGSQDIADYIINQKKNTALSWFNAIALFSVINAFLILSNTNLNFLIGLGSITWIGYIAQILSARLGGQIVFIGFIFELSIAWFFYFVRKQSAKDIRWLFAGLIVYSLDSLLLIPIKGYLGVAFHIFVIVMILQYFKFSRLANTNT